MPKEGKSKLKVNFGGVDEEIRKHTEKSKRVPEGDYLVKILGGEVKKPEDSDKSKYINWKAQVVKGKHKGVVLYGMTSLKPEALWNLRNLINAATGKNVAGKSVNLDLDTLVGKIVGASVEDNEYKKDGTTKITSRINTWFPKDEYADPGEDEEEEDEDEDEDEDEEEEDEDEEELDEVEVEDI